jgi:hypothetical protein
MVNNLVGGIPSPLKNDGVKVSRNDDIPTRYGSLKLKSSWRSYDETMMKLLKPALCGHKP